MCRGHDMCLFIFSSFSVFHTVKVAVYLQTLSKIFFKPNKWFLNKSWTKSMISSSYAFSKKNYFEKLKLMLVIHKKNSIFQENFVPTLLAEIWSSPGGIRKKTYQVLISPIMRCLWAVYRQNMFANCEASNFSKCCFLKINFFTWCNNGARFHRCRPWMGKLLFVLKLKTPEVVIVCLWALLFHSLL